MKFLSGNCKSNLRKLEVRVGELRTAKGEIENEVVEAQRKGEKIQQDVQLWLTNVDEITAKTDQFFQDESEAQQKYLHGFCPNLTIHRRRSKKASILLQEAVDVYEMRRELPAVSCGILLQPSTGDYLAFQSRMGTVKQIMDELKNPDTVRIGLYGIAGVGKSALVKHVYKQATEDEDFFQDVVLVEDVKKIQEPEELQKTIVRKLGMTVFENLITMQYRADNLRTKINRKKSTAKSTLVILDDVSEPIDLEAVGLHSSYTCKIMLTSTISKALSDMNTQKEFWLETLKEEEAWGLFEHKVGDVVLDPTIRKTAKKVAKQCGGLPLLIVTVASALKGRTTLPLWEDALTCLQKGSDREGKFMEKAYLGLEWSYSQLNDCKELKPLFLLCGFTAKGNDILLTDLLKYTLGLGFFENPCTLEQAHNALHSWVDKLQEYCLLVGTEDKRCVKMHELVLEVAGRIAFKDQHILSLKKHGGAAGEFNIWPDKGFLEKCTAISFPSANSNTPSLPEVMHCPTLQMFLLDADYSLKISPRFFERMIQLKVLSLTSDYRWSLPKSLQFQENLRTLCLSGKVTNISLVGHLRNLEILSVEGSAVKKLPRKIGQLKRLRLLDLSNCYKLKVISRGVLSSLDRLEDLRMINSFDYWDGNYWEDAKSRWYPNASLSELRQLCHLTALEIRVPKANILPADFFSLKLVRFHIIIGEIWDTVGVEVNADVLHQDPKTRPPSSLNTLKLDLTGFTKHILLDQGLKRCLRLCEDLSLNGLGRVSHIVHQLDSEDFQQLKHLHILFNVDFTYINKKMVVLSTLTTLCVDGFLDGCKDLRFLFTWSMAWNLVQLKRLEISNCEHMEEVVSSTEEHEERNIDSVFSKLEFLKLNELKNLARFCTGSYIEFPSLKDLEISECKKLGSFISDVKSGTVAQDTLYGEFGEAHVAQGFLFDDKVGFRNLERLRIRWAVQFKKIWHVQLAEHSFRRLRQVEIAHCSNLINIFPHGFMRRLNALHTLDIYSCRSLEEIIEVKRSNAQETHQDSSFPRDHQLKGFYYQNVVSISVMYCTNLRKIFPAKVAKSLQNLCELIVQSCDKVVDIVGEEEDGVFKTSFLFPKLISLDLSFLPELMSFYPMMHSSKWPLLRNLVVRDCKKVKTFTAEAKLSISPEKHQMEPLMSQQSLFLIDKDSFQNLEHLQLESVEIWNGPPPAELLFGKLKSIEIMMCAAFSTLPFLASAPNLEKIEVKWDDSQEIFVDEEGTESSVGSYSLKHAKCLNLYGMTKLMYLGKKNSQSTGRIPIFPNLETLEVESCNRLKNLWSSAISFQNLTTLKVERCDELEYLTTYSVAKSLVQLTTLEVRRCESMVVLVAIDGKDDDAGYGIAFIRLQRLKLSSLPSLQGFCSGNRIVIFPSSMTLLVTHCEQFKVSHEWVRIMDPIQQAIQITEKKHQDQDEPKEDDNDDDDELKGEDDDEDHELADVETVGHEDDEDYELADIRSTGRATLVTAEDFKTLMDDL